MLTNNSQVKKELTIKILNYIMLNDNKMVIPNGNIKSYGTGSDYKEIYSLKCIYRKRKKTKNRHIHLKKKKVNTMMM